MDYRLVIFDFDGTLADTFPWFCSVFNQVAEKFGFRTADPTELDALRNLDGHSLLRRLGVPLWKVPLIATHMRGLMAHDLERIKLFNGVDAALGSLEQSGKTIAIVSSNSAENIRRILGVETSSRVHHYECGVAMFGKPSKLKRVLAKTRVSREETLFIGDEIRDAEAAREVGVPFGAVSWGFNSAQALQAQSPDEVFASIDQLIDRLASRR